MRRVICMDPLAIMLLLLPPTEPSLLLHMHNYIIYIGAIRSYSIVDLDDDLQLVRSLGHFLALISEDLNPAIA